MDTTGYFLELRLGLELCTVYIIYFQMKWENLNRQSIRATKKNRRKGKMWK